MVEPMRWKNLPDKSTPLTADVLNSWTDDIVLVSETAEASAAAAQQAAQDAVAPTDTVMANTVSTEGTETRTALNNTYVPQAVPSYAGARTKTWDPALHLYNGESPTMRTLRLAVAAARKGTTGLYVACLGDSKTFGSNLVGGMAADSYPGQLQDLLGGVPGLIYGNSGDLRWSARTGFANAVSTSQNYLDGSNTVDNAVTLTTTKPHTGAVLYGFCGAGGSATVTVDGVPQTWTIAASASWRSLTITGLANTTHTIKVESPAASNMSLLGIRPTYDGSVLAVANAGRSSSTAADWLPQNWSTLWGSAVNGPNIPLPGAVLLNIGRNTGTSTLADIGTVAANVDALGIPLLLCAFGATPIDATYNAKRAALYDAADTLDVPLLDFTDVVGDDAAATAAGLMVDTVHENARGYSLEAAAVARALALA